MKPRGVSLDGLSGLDCTLATEMYACKLSRGSHFRGEDSVEIVAFHGIL